MEKEVFYSGFSQGISAVKFNTGGIEEILRFSNYKPLGRQVNEIRPAEKLEDPPETLHTPWGVWLHRDPLHRIEQRYDTEHMLRAARAADDILHYANYVPKIGKDEQNIESHEPNFEYNYSHEGLTYNVSTKLEEEDVKDVETAIDIRLEDSVNSDNKHEEIEHNEEENLSIDGNSKDNSGTKFKKDLIRIIEKLEAM